MTTIALVLNINNSGNEIMILNIGVQIFLSQKYDINKVIAKEEKVYINIKVNPALSLAPL